jgi:hypothetical protein
MTAGAAGGGGSRFQQSLDRERALTANRAATFAAAAPLPATDRASAFGSVAASKAARGAYVGDQQARANLDGGNYFHNVGMASAANARANAESGANVGLVDSQAGLNRSQAGRVDAEANVLVPAQGRHVDAQAADLTSQSAARDYMTPLLGDQAAAAARGANAAAAGQEATNRFVPDREAAAVRQAGAQANQLEAMTPILAEQGRAAAYKTNAESGAINAQADLMTRPTPPTVDPSVELERRKQAGVEADRAYEEQPGLFGTGIGRGVRGDGPVSKFLFGSNKTRDEILQEKLRQMTPMTPTPGGTPPAASQEGSIRYNPATKQHYQLKGGQWVPVAAPRAAAR